MENIQTLKSVQHTICVKRGGNIFLLHFPADRRFFSLSLELAEEEDGAWSRLPLDIQGGVGPPAPTTFIPRGLGTAPPIYCHTERLFTYI